jgi:hypothetical protein
MKPVKRYKHNMNRVDIHKTKTLNDKAERTTITVIIIKIIIN